MKRGDKGAAVLAYQEDLRRLGYPLPKSTRTDGSLDGIAGAEVLGATRLLEQDRHWRLSPESTVSDKTLTRAREAKPYARGLDVSKHQSVIDWKAVYAAGYRFAIIKATEGRSYVDPFFELNYDGARAAGLTVGVYHFWWVERDPKAQAAHLAKTYQFKPGDLPPSLDVEQEHDLEPAEVNERLQLLIDETKRLFGVTPLIYSSHRVYKEWGLKVGGECPFWMVRWGADPLLVKPWTDWKIWQTGPAQGVPGIRGPVDRNLMKEEL